MGDGFAGNCRADRCLQIVVLGLRTLLADIEIPVVDAAVVHLVQRTARDDEDGGLRRDSCVSEGYERLLRVKQGFTVNREIAIVLLDDGSGIAAVGIHPPEADCLPREFIGQSRNFRDVSVGDRAVAGGKDEHDDADAGTGEFANWMAM